MDNPQDSPGSNTAAYFAARGVHLSPEESRELAALVLRLADLGAVCARVDERAGGEHPQDARHTRAHGTCGASEGNGRTGCVPGPLDGPTVYNMGPSVHGDSR